MNKLLYLYIEGEGFRSYDLNGASSALADVPNVEFFTVDGRSNVIYFHHTQEDKIWMYNITSGQYHRVADLSDVSSIKDLDMDDTNRYLHFLMHILLFIENILGVLIG